MNDTRLQLPKRYIPYKELIICSNQFINGKVPFKLGGHIPFLVGKGTVPLIWLYYPFELEDGRWEEMVVNNKSKTKRINIITTKKNGSVIIKLNKHILIHVTKLADNKSEVVELDLRPLRINIFGDIKGLKIGPQTLSNNIFKDVDTMINIS